MRAWALDLCWDHGILRWHDPVAGQHLMTLAEERRAKFAAEARANAEREARIAEREARVAAEARLRELEERLESQDEG